MDRQECLSSTIIATLHSFHDKRHPSSMGGRSQCLLTHLAVVKSVSASTQNQGLSAILFFYRNVLDDPLTLATQVCTAARRLRVRSTTRSNRRAALPQPREAGLQLSE
jgi:hypothetical protein